MLLGSGRLGYNRSKVLCIEPVLTELGFPCPLAGLCYKAWMVRALYSAAFLALELATSG